MAERLRQLSLDEDQRGSIERELEALRVRLDTKNS